MSAGGDGISQQSFGEGEATGPEQAPVGHVAAGGDGLAGCRRCVRTRWGDQGRAGSGRLGGCGGVAVEWGIGVGGEGDDVGMGGTGQGKREVAQGIARSHTTTEGSEETKNYHGGNGGSGGDMEGGRDGRVREMRWVGGMGWHHGAVRGCEVRAGSSPESARGPEAAGRAKAKTLPRSGALAWSQMSPSITRMSWRQM